MNTPILAFLRASCCFLLASLLMCLGSPAQAKRKDVVTMNNGDHFTGQVKRLQNGLLYVETDYASGNIGLDWDQVESVQSTATYRIVLNDGERLEGKIENEKRPGSTGLFLISVWAHSNHITGVCLNASNAR